MHRVRIIQSNDTRFPFPARERQITHVPIGYTFCSNVPKKTTDKLKGAGQVLCGGSARTVYHLETHPFHFTAVNLSLIHFMGNLWLYLCGR